MGTYSTSGKLRIVRISAVALMLMAGVPNTSFGTSTCRPISGHVDFGALEVLPPQPRVGDQVELRFTASFNVFGVSSVSLEGAAPLFEGEMRNFGTVTTFHLTAISAGTATVRLSVNYATEEACDDGNGGTYFQVGPNQTTNSQSYTVAVGPAAATPTPTFSPTPTREAGNAGDSGCAIDRGRGGAAWLLAPLAFALCRRRKLKAR